MGIKAKHGDISWYIPKRKTPIAYSTKAACDLIVLLSQEGGTICEIQARINYDTEAKAVLQAYINKGYGEQIAAEWFR